MPSHSSVAARVREDKAANPHLYCANPKCLWKIVTNAGPNPCRNHPAPLDLPAIIRTALDANPVTLNRAVAAVESALVDYAQRPLTQSEVVKVGIEVVCGWNARRVQGERFARVIRDMASAEVSP